MGKGYVDKRLCQSAMSIIGLSAEIINDFREAMTGNVRIKLKKSDQ